MPRPFASLSRVAAAALLAALAASGVAFANPPSPEDLEKARAEVEEAERLAREQSDTFTESQAELARLADIAGLALQEFDEADRAFEQAQRDLLDAKERMALARESAKRAHGDIGRWATSTYRYGSDVGSDLARLAALSRGKAGDLASTQWTLNRIGNTRNALLDRAREAEATARDAEEASAAAQRRADTKRIQATEKKKVADAAQAKQQEHVDAMRADLERTEYALSLARGEEQRLAEAKAQADAERARAIAAANNPSDILGPVGSCVGGPLKGFPNGRIPTAALCPVWAAPGKFLRADAAAAFERMSHEYAKSYGTPLCVTDAYRDYDNQVHLKATRGKWAATPGTSNHGWARAVDLCGGVEHFGHTAHQWMRANAPRFGWYHPTWARPNGSLPEPWHWEYAG